MNEEPASPASHWPPLILLTIILLSLRTDRPSFRNWIIIVLGAVASWTIIPNSSAPSKAMGIVLIAFAIILSPLQVLFFRSEPIENEAAIDILYDPEDAKWDIIAVHGLGSSVKTSWMHRKSNKIWLKDFLPGDLPNARIMTYRHNSVWTSNANVKDLVDHAKQFLDAIVNTRGEQGDDRPIIFIGHSFGGLLIEQALVEATHQIRDEDTANQYSLLRESLAGIVFLGTPHGGSSYTTIGKFICHFTYWLGSSTMLLSSVERDSETTANLENEFLQAFDKVPTVDFQEMVPNKVLGFNLQLVVTKRSAARGGQKSIPLDTDHSGLNKFSSSDDPSYQSVLGQLKSMMHRKAKQLKAKVEKDDSNTLKVLQWLKPCNFDNIDTKHAQEFVDGTCMWITQEKSYSQWQEDKTILWILGKPGAGKTFIAHHLYQTLAKTGRLLMRFFFDSKNAENKDLQSLAKFYPTILHQLLDQLRPSNMHSHIPLKERKECFSIVRQKMLAGELGERSLKECLRQVLPKVGPTVLIIDALDECKGEHVVKPLKAWLDDQQSHQGMKTVVTSRPEKKILDEIETGGISKLNLSLLIEKSNNDIKMFIQKRLQDSTYLKEMKGLHATIEQKLVEKANGMILYTSLTVKVLENTPGPEIEAELERLPSNLADLYKKCLEQIQNKEFAKAIFQWLIVSRRPLTVDGLREAYETGSTVAMKRDSKRRAGQGAAATSKMPTPAFQDLLRTQCLPLIEVLEDKSVRFVHTTVAQFLRGEYVEGSSSISSTASDIDFRIDISKSHEHVAVVCIYHLWKESPSIKVGDSSHDWTSRNFPAYAIMEWAEHTQKSENLIMSDLKTRTALQSFSVSQKLTAWLRVRGELDRRFFVHFALHEDNAYQRVKPLHIAAYFNLARLVHAAFQPVQDQSNANKTPWEDNRHKKFLDVVNAQDATESTPLHIAAERNATGIVKDLLHAGADIELPDSHGSFAIHRAARHGHLATLETLINHGANVNAKDKYRFTPLHIVCQLGWIECAQVLILHKAEISADSNAVDTPLGLAIANGHENIVQYLLQQDKSLVAHCGKPLVQASRKGSIKMVQFLAAQGADLSCTDVMGQTALHKACISGNEVLVNYLLSRSRETASVNAVDTSERTPLYFAAERGFLKIVESLVENGADVNRLDRRWETALFKPAGRGHTAVVEYLLKQKINATRLNKWQRSPLKFACFYGRKDIVRILLSQTDIDQTKPDWVGTPPLHDAATSLREGQEEVIDILFQDTKHPLSPEIPGWENENALHAAIRRMSDHPPPTEVLLKKLIDYHVPLNHLDNFGMTPLACAVESRNPDLVRYLLDSRASTSKDSLHRAVNTGIVEIVKMILKSVSRLEFDERVSSSSETALHIAAKTGNDNVVIALLGAGVSAWCLDMDKKTALEKARGLGKDAMEQLRKMTLAPSDDPNRHDLQSSEEGIRHLLSDGDKNKQDRYGRTSLHWATLSGSLNSVQQLLSSKVDHGLKDTLDQTPLHYTAETGNLEILEALLSSGADINAQDLRLRTPLHFAVHNNAEPTTSCLISAGASVIPDHHGRTALHDAAHLGHEKIISILLVNGVTQDVLSHGDDDGDTALHDACHSGHENIVRMLLEHVEQVDIVNKQKKTPLHLASKKGNFTIVQSLLKAGALSYKLDGDRFMPMHYAAEGGHVGIVKELLAAIPDGAKQWVNSLARDRFWKDEAGDEYPTLGVLRDHGVLVVDAEKPQIIQNQRFNTESRRNLEERVIYALKTWDYTSQSIPGTVLNRAVAGRSIDLVEFLLQDIPGNPSETPDYYGMGPLKRAASLGLPDIVAALIKAGSDIHLVSDSQQTCLHLASENGHVNVVEILLESGVSVDLARYRDGQTALHVAVQKGHTEVVKALVRMAFINAIDDKNQTPLHIATRSNSQELIDLLLDADADVFLQDIEGKTPQNIASDNGNEAILRRLQEQGEEQKLREVPADTNDWS